jgi:nitroimidazol reductase NimA-like FMN-containing flavoprotein (pyridoxamine 5'-phosphate oxidase superfamily)
MLIQEMTRGDSLSLLKSMRLGRLACAKDVQPYITPFYFSFARNYLYSFSTVGQRIEWMRENPLVCVETDEVMSSQEWVSIIIFGSYQELADTPEWERERASAHDLLQRHPDWWEPGYVKTTIDGRDRPLDPVYFRIEISETAGHRATANGGGDQLG